MEHILNIAFDFDDNRVRDQLLSSKSRVDRHDQHHVNLWKYPFNRRQRSCRI